MTEMKKIDGEDATLVEVKPKRKLGRLTVMLAILTIIVLTISVLL